jgi:hypothetical protein
MRYMLAILLAVGIGVATAVPPALALTVDEDGNYINQYGNRVTPRGNNYNPVCYVDGVAYLATSIISCTK